MRELYLNKAVTEKAHYHNKPCMASCFVLYVNIYLCSIMLSAKTYIMPVVTPFQKGHSGHELGK